MLGFSHVQLIRLIFSILYTDNVCLWRNRYKCKLCFPGLLCHGQVHLGTAPCFVWGKVWIWEMQLSEKKLEHTYRTVELWQLKQFLKQFLLKWCFLLFEGNTNEKKNTQIQSRNSALFYRKFITYINRDLQFNNLTWLNFMRVEFKFKLEKIEEINWSFNIIWQAVLLDHVN